VQHQIEHALCMAVEEERRRRDLVDPAGALGSDMPDSAQAPVNISHQWPRRTTVWRKGARFARGFMLRTSNRQRGAIL